MFGKIFESLYSGSMVGAGPVVFAVWPYVIANMKPDRVHGMVVWINPTIISAAIGKVTDADVTRAIEFLCAPDERSTTRVEEGRRLVKIHGFQYRVVNGEMYRKIRDEETRREQNREAQRRYRQEKSRKAAARLQKLGKVVNGIPSAEPEPNVIGSSSGFLDGGGE